MAVERIAAATVLNVFVDFRLARRDDVERELKERPREDGQREVGHGGRLLHVDLADQTEQVDDVPRRADVHGQELRESRATDVAFGQNPLADDDQKQQRELEEQAYRGQVPARVLDSCMHVCARYFSTNTQNKSES